MCVGHYAISWVETNEQTDVIFALLTLVVLVGKVASKKETPLNVYLQNTIDEAERFGCYEDIYQGIVF